jgi:serine/threonine protein kinase
LQTSSPGAAVSLAGGDHTRAHLSPLEVTWSPAAARVATAGSIAPSDLLAGRYRILRQLGRDGMGIVYHADDLRLGHAVALKFLPSALAADEHRLNAFHREVSVARQITHPNVCRVYDIGDADGHLFLSMEYIDGEDLATAIARRGAMPESEGIELVRQFCAGLAAVHVQGVLHRDLKPANIMLGPHGRRWDWSFTRCSPDAGRSRRIRWKS